MTASPPHTENIWLAAGVRTPFAKIDGALSKLDAIAMSVPVVKHMVGQLAGGKPVSICADGGQGTVALLQAA
jgi:hypothetical protein